MDLSRLKWIKVVTPPAKGWDHPWAVSPEEIEDPKLYNPELPFIHLKNRLTVVALGFKNEKANEPAVGDLIVGCQVG